MNPNDTKDVEESIDNSTVETQSSKVQKNENNTSKKRGKKRKLSKNDKNDEPANKKKKRGWSETEEKSYLEGLELFGRDYDAISKHIGTRDTASVRSHTQIHFLKLLKNKKKLPKKVIESGNGYTLSGKPLNKYSSTVLKLFKSPKDVPTDMGGVISDEEAANKLKKPKKDDNNKNGSKKAEKSIKKRKKKKNNDSSEDEYDPDTFSSKYNKEPIKRRDRINRKSKNVRKILDHENDEYQLREDIIIYKLNNNNNNINNNNIKNNKIKRINDDTIQPFKIYYCPNALLIGDLHAHLCSEVEIMGFMAGIYDKDKKEVYIKKLYPLNEEEQHEKSVVADAIDQFTVKQNIEDDGYMYLGWYHSHPCFNNYPSNTDLYQHFVQKSSNELERPFIGLIISSWQSPYSPNCQYRWFNSVREDDGNYTGFEFIVEPKKHINIDDNGLITQITSLINRYTQMKYDAFRANLNGNDWENENNYNFDKLKKYLNNIKNANNGNNNDINNNNDNNDDNEDDDEDDDDNKEDNNKENLGIKCINNKDKILYSLVLNMEDDGDNNKSEKLINCILQEFDKNKEKWFI